MDTTSHFSQVHKPEGLNLNQKTHKGPASDKMQLWNFAKVKGSTIPIDRRLAEAMGMLEGNQVYSVLFRYDQSGSKSYELILSAFGPDSYRNLSHVTIHMRDVPGALAQAARFLSDRGVNILNSVSLSVISDLGMVWKILVDPGFYAELDLIEEDFMARIKKGDPSVSKLDHVEVQRSEIGRIFSRGSSLYSSVSGKVEQKRAGPDPLNKEGYLIPDPFLEVLGDVNGSTVMIVADPDNWILTVTFLRRESRLVHISFSIPDSPGSVYNVTKALADEGVNLLSVFTKVHMYHQRMVLETVADISRCPDQEGLRSRISNYLQDLDGYYDMTEYSSVDL